MKWGGKLPSLKSSRLVYKRASSEQHILDTYPLGMILDEQMATH